MSQPEGFIDASKPTHVCQLHKYLYGLIQAPRNWFNRLKTALLSWGFTNSTSDTSLFTKFLGTKSLFFLVYMDDIFITSSDHKLIKDLIAILHKTFALKTLGQVGYFLGFEAHHDNPCLYLTQAKYISDFLHKTNMVDFKPGETPIATGTKLSISDGIAFSDPTLCRSTMVLDNTL